MVLIDSVFKICENYYPRAFLEKCKYFVKQIKRYIPDKTEFSSDESRKTNDSDEKNDVN